MHYVFVKAKDTVEIKLSRVVRVAARHALLRLPQRLLLKSLR
jgi:hypothetical protein